MKTSKKSNVFSIIMKSGLLIVGIITLGAAANAKSLSISEKRFDGPVCGGSSRGPLVSLSWMELPKEESVFSTNNGHLTLMVKNNVKQRVSLNLRLGVNGGGNETYHNLGTIHLAPGKVAHRAIELLQLPVPWLELRTSCSLWVKARVLDRDGTPQERAYSPPAFVHNEAGTTQTSVPPQLVAYRTGTLLTRYRGGDFAGTFRTNPNFGESILLQDVGPGLRGDFTPNHTPVSSATAPAPLPEVFIPNGGEPGGIPGGPDGYAIGRQVCFLLRTDFVDGDFGDYATEDLQPALGVRYHVGIPWVGIYTGNASRSTGCFTLPVDTNDPFYVTMFFESDLGYGDRHLRLRAFSDWHVNGEVPWSHTVWKQAGGTPEHMPRNSFYVEPNPGNGTIWLATHPSNSKMAGLLAAASVGISRFEEEAKPPAMAAGTIWDMEIIPRSCPGWPEKTSCAGVKEISIATPDKDARRKFLIGHEVGHWYQKRWVGGFAPIDYSLDVDVIGCESENIHGAHALRSKEYAGGAHTEGFAHFLSTLAFNNPGSNAEFKYYKDYAPYGYDYELVDVSATPDFVGPIQGGPIDVLHNVCGCGDGSCTDGAGVELDWLRFYWHYAYDAGTAPSLAGILDHIDDAHGSMTSESVFEPLADQLQGALLQRWLDLGEAYGTDPTPWMSIGKYLAY